MIQPLNKAIGVTADANGNATFTFESIPFSQYWTGVLQCPTAPYTAQFTATQNGADYIGAFAASNPYGPLQLTSGQLQVTATGLVAGVAYTMYYIGVAATEEPTVPVFPAPSANVVIATNQGGLKGTFIRIPGGGFQTILPPPPVGSAYRLHSITTLNSGITSTANGAVELTDFGTTPSTIFFAKSWITGQQVEATFYFNGLLCSGEIDGTVSAGMAQVYVHLRYDIIEI